MLSTLGTLGLRTNFWPHYWYNSILGSPLCVYTQQHIHTYLWNLLFPQLPCVILLILLKFYSCSKSSTVPILSYRIPLFYCTSFLYPLVFYSCPVFCAVLFLFCSWTALFLSCTLPCSILFCILSCSTPVQYHACLIPFCILSCSIPVRYPSLYLVLCLFLYDLLLFFSCPVSCPVLFLFFTLSCSVPVLYPFCFIP